VKKLLINIIGSYSEWQTEDESIVDLTNFSEDDDVTRFTFDSEDAMLTIEIVDVHDSYIFYGVGIRE
jgi:hypothetical protein